MQYLVTSNERCEMTRKSIVLAADNAYLIPLEMTIKSVLYHNRDVDFYILNSDIAPE